MNVIFIQLYHNLQPYEAYANDVLQQLCQFSIFVTMLSALVLKVKPEDRSSPTILTALFSFGLIPPVVAFMMSIIHNRKQLQDMKASLTKMLANVINHRKASRVEDLLPSIELKTESAAEPAVAPRSDAESERSGIVKFYIGRSRT